MKNVRIKVRKNPDGTTNAVIITFNTRPQEFDSNSERNKFFKELHGWQQTVPNNGKKYVYRRPGLLDEIPHQKIADSVFMIMEEHMKRMEQFIQQWNQKVDWEMHRVMVERRNFPDMKEPEANVRRFAAKGILTPEENKRKFKRVEVE